MKLKRRIQSLMFSLLFRPRRHSLNPRNVLFLCYDAVGDLLVTTPLFREFKQHFPDVTVAAMVTSRNYRVVLNSPYVDTVYISDTIGLTSLKSWIQMWKISHVKYDIAIDLWDRISFTRLLKLRLFNARQLVALRNVDVEKSKGIRYEQLNIYDDIIEPADSRHFSVRMCAALKYFGYTQSSYQYDFFIPKDIAKPSLGQTGKTRIFVNYRGTQANRSLEEAGIATVLHQLTKHGDYELLIDSFGLSEQKLENLKQLLADIATIYINAGLYETVSMLDQCDAVVTTDTATVHIASARKKSCLYYYTNACCMSSSVLDH